LHSKPWRGRALRRSGYVKDLALFVSPVLIIGEYKYLFPFMVTLSPFEAPVNGLLARFL
jgi:hypothetical protein